MTPPLVQIEPCAPMSAAALSSMVQGNYSYNEKNGAFSVGGQNVVTFNSTTTPYCFRSINMTGQARIQVLTGPVTIKVTGTIGSTGGSFANLTAIPANLRIESSYTGNGGVSLGGGNNSFFTLYAPHTDVTLQAGTFFGEVLGRTLTVQGSTQVHYDNATTTAGWLLWKSWSHFYLPLPFVTP